MKTSAKNASILINGNLFSTYVTSYEAEASVEPIEATGFLDGSKNYVPGQKTAKITADMMWDADTDKVHDAMNALPSGIVSIIPELAAVAGPSISLPYMQANYNPKGETSSLITIGSIGFESSGSNFGVEFGKVLYSGVVTDTTTGTTVDNGAATSTRYSAVLHVYTATTADTYEVKVEHSTDGNTWATLCTFTADGQTVTAERITGTSVNRYRRAVATVTGTDGDDFGFTVVLHTL
jgi:hypothetical protein